MLEIPGTDTVIYQNHREIFRHTTGFDSIEKQTMLTPDRLYNIYSCSKIATAVAALQLIERGEILATDPVYAYFPEYKNLTVKVYGENGNVTGIRPAEKQMLIQHLLTMTSGLNYDLDSPSIKAVVASTGGKAPTLDVCRAIANEPLEFDPGEKYNYSLSLDVMAGIVELVSGEKFSDYMQNNVFAPLGMKETAYHVDESKRDRFAAHYEYIAGKGRGAEIPFESNRYRLGTEFDSGGAGVVSSVDDYILLIDALANGGVGKTGERILSSRSIDVMRTNALTPEQIKNQFAIHPYTHGYGYGYGVRMKLADTPSGILASTGEFGWDGAKLCLAMADPSINLAVFHAEHMGGLHSIVVPRLRNVIYACLDD